MSGERSPQDEPVGRTYYKDGMVYHEVPRELVEDAELIPVPSPHAISGWPDKPLTAHRVYQLVKGRQQDERTVIDLMATLRNLEEQLDAARQALDHTATRKDGDGQLCWCITGVRSGHFLRGDHSKYCDEARAVLYPASSPVNPAPDSDWQMAQLSPEEQEARRKAYGWESSE